MTAFNRSRPYLPLLACLFALGGFLYFFNVPEPAPANDDTPLAIRAYWEGEIRARGHAAYEAFTQWNADASHQHQNAHIMGEVLYAEYGIEGFSSCDSTFGFGCYHGFFGRAVSEGGTDVVAQLDAACVTAYGPLGTGCQHGIGHGILEYVGTGHLVDALELCGKTTEIAPRLGCADGVFMEYNTPLAEVSSAKTPQTRAFDPEHPYDPCGDVPDRYADVCYFELGHYAVIQGLPLDSFCSELTGSARASCLVGIGDYAAALGRYALDEAVATCVALSADDEVACRAGVRWAFWSNPQHRASEGSACSFDDPTKTERCETLGDLTDGLDPNP